jgi:uncharacterized membrane protein YoaK (UPF0700 family)
MAGEKKAYDPAGLIQSFWFMGAFSFIGGFINAYSFLMRGGVFASKQSANAVLLGIYLFQGHRAGMLEALPPILATVAGAFFASFIKSRRNLPEGWWQMRILYLHIPVFIIVGFIPGSAPHAAANIPLSFMAAILLSAFRQYNGWIFNPTILTGNLRSMGEYLYRALFVEKDNAYRKKTAAFFALLLLFFLGCFMGAAASDIWGVRAIWAGVPVFLILSAAHWRLCRRSR